MVEQKPHPIFKRKGDDLYIEKEIDLATALCGGNFLVNHLDDRKILVHILPGEVITPNAIKYVAGEGMPG